ncbi:MAG: hypothetical protein ACLQNE_05945 [Thermoguttaceae bacterium]
MTTGSQAKRATECGWLSAFSNSFSMRIADESLPIVSRWRLGAFSIHGWQSSVELRTSNSRTSSFASCRTTRNVAGKRDCVWISKSQIASGKIAI